MSVNFYKNRDEMVSAYKEVIQEKSNTNWALFGYEKQTNDLALIDKGEGGLDELMDGFNSSKILYAFCKVFDPNTELIKYILINWQGEGAPLQRKGICINHFRDIHDFFKGSHLTINARTEDDVEPEVILSKISKISAKVNLKERSDLSENISPVGSTYKRVQPQREISQTDREKFWVKTQEEERIRVMEEKKKLNENRAKTEKEREEREYKELRQREASAKEREENIAKIRESEKNAENSVKNGTNINANADKNDDNERRQRSEHLRRERAQEVKSAISQSSIKNARAVFEQNSSAGQMNSNRVTSQSNNNKLISSRKDLFESNSDQSLPKVTEKSVKSEPKFNENYSQISVIKSDVKEEPVVIPPVVETPIVHPLPTIPIEEPISEKFDEISTVSANGQQFNTHEDQSSDVVYTRNLLQETYLESHPLEDIAEEQTWEDSNNVNVGQNEDQYDSTENVLSGDRETNGNEVALKKARALFDYQAADDTEISFDPDDVITHIEQIDSGWWQGLAPDGTYGLFPANYVELID